MCEMVINHSSRPVNVNAKNHDGVTPLHMAALYNSESCTMLLKYDADVNSATNYGYTPLQYAAKNGCYKACRLLCKIEDTDFKGRVVYHLNEKLNIDSQNYYEDTALHLVINTRNAVIMHSKKKWPFNTCTDRYTKIVKFLLFMGADVNLQNYDGDTPLHLAARYEMEYIVKLLLHYNADVNIRNKKYEMAVDLTRKHGEDLIYRSCFKTTNSILKVKLKILKNIFSKYLFTSVPQRIRQLQVYSWKHVSQNKIF